MTVPEPKYPSSHALAPREMVIGAKRSMRQKNKNKDSNQLQEKNERVIIKHKLDTSNVQQKEMSNNRFDVLQRKVVDCCKVCKKEFKSILQHLNRSTKCASEYDLDLLRNETKKKQEQIKKKNI